MFRILRDASSGSTELCLTEITSSDSQYFVVCLVGAWQRNFEPVVCVRSGRPANRPYLTNTHTTGSKLRCQTQTKHMKKYCESLRVVSVKHSPVLPDDGSRKIRNMSKWLLIF